MPKHMCSTHFVQHNGVKIWARLQIGSKITKISKGPCALHNTCVSPNVAHNTKCAICSVHSTLCMTLRLFLKKLVLAHEGVKAHMEKVKDQVRTKGLPPCNFTLAPSSHLFRTNVLLPQNNGFFAACRNEMMVLSASKDSGLGCPQKHQA